MIQVCTRPPEVLPARRLPAEAFCALARQGAGSVYRPRWEVLRMLAVGEAWGAAPADGSPGCALLLLPREADVSLAAALREHLGGLAPRGDVLTPPVGPARGVHCLPAVLQGALRAAQRRAPTAPVLAVLDTGPELEAQLDAYFAAGFALRALRPLNTLAPQCLLSTAAAPAAGQQVQILLADATHLALLLARGWAAVSGRHEPGGYLLQLMPPA